LGVIVDEAFNGPHRSAVESAETDADVIKIHQNGSSDLGGCSIGEETNGRTFDSDGAVSFVL